MDAAKEWSIPPWKIAGGSKVLWYSRYTARRDIEIREAQRIRQKAKSKK